MQRYVNNSDKICCVYIHPHPSLSDIETIRNIHSQQHDEPRIYHNRHSYEDQNCGFGTALWKGENGHVLQRDVSNLYQICFVCIHHHPFLSHIEKILNLCSQQHDEARMYHNHHSYEDQDCRFLTALCKDENGHVFLRYGNNSYHICFVCIHHHPFLSNIETILNLHSQQHDEARMYHNHHSYEDQNYSSPKALCKDENYHEVQRYVNNSHHFCVVYIHHHPFLLDIETILNLHSQ